MYLPKISVRVESVQNNILYSYCVDAQLHTHGTYAWCHISPLLYCCVSQPTHSPHAFSKMRSKHWYGVPFLNHTSYIYHRPQPSMSFNLTQRGHHTSCMHSRNHPNSHNLYVQGQTIGIKLIAGYNASGELNYVPRVFCDLCVHTK